MSERRAMVVGNWKMHGSRAANAALVEGVLAALPRGPEVTVCPPFVYLAELAARLEGTPVQLGAQNVCAVAESGAHTGEVAASMLREVGCRQVIVGHSERRAGHGETDALVARKVLAALAAGLEPIICVGEQLDDRDAGRTEAVVGQQLEAVLAAIETRAGGMSALPNCVIAYEPVWAIGTGRTATPEQAQQVHAFIRGRVAARDAIIAGSVRILYGGSVKPGNARELFGMADVDGGLIGGASLKADEFVATIAAAVDREAHLR